MSFIFSQRVVAANKVAANKVATNKVTSIVDFIATRVNAYCRSQPFVTVLLGLALVMAGAAPDMARASDETPSLPFAPQANPDRPADGCKSGSENSSFFTRLSDAYATHLQWNGADPSLPAAKVVGGAEIPVSNPPWPYATWNVGGTPAIGVENLTSNALMDAL